MIAGLAIYARSNEPSDATEERRSQALVGVTGPSHLAKIAAEQSGTIVRIHAHEGEHVESGSALFQLSDRLHRLEVERLEAQLASNLERERAAAELQHANQRASRVRTLTHQRISAEADAADADLDSQLARLALDRVEFDQELLRNDLAQARERLAQRTLRSPMNGLVTRHLKQTGETADQLEPVVEVMSLDPLWVTFHCPVQRENDFPLGSRVRLTPTQSAAQPRWATIEHVSMQSTVAGHTFAVRASMPNPGYDWRSGLKVLVEPAPPTNAAPPRGK